MARKWQNRFDGAGHTTRAEHRDHAVRKQAHPGRNQNYRTNRQHPNFADEVAQGQALCDQWAESFGSKDEKDQPRGR